MCKTVVLFFCLACTSCGRRTRSSAWREQSKRFSDNRNPSEETDPNTGVQSLIAGNDATREATLWGLLELDAALAFNVHGFGGQAHFVSASPAVAQGHPAFLRSKSTSRARSEMDLDQTLEELQKSMSQSLREQNVAATSRVSLEDLQVGSEVEGKIVRMITKIAWIDIGTVTFAMLRISNCSEELVNDLRKKFAAGESVRLQIKRVLFEIQQVEVTCKAAEISGDSKDKLAMVEPTQDKIKRISLNEGQQLTPEEKLHLIESASAIDKIEVNTVDVHGSEDGSSGPGANVERVALEALEIGTEVEGKIVRITGLGVFVDVGTTVEALLSSSEVVHLLASNQKERLTEGQTVKGQIKDVDVKNQKVWMTCRTSLDNFVAGSKVKGKIVRVLPFGAYVDVGGWHNALLHVSDVDPAYIKNFSQVFRVGETIECRIQSINQKTQKLRLSYQDPLSNDKTSLEQRVQRMQLLNAAFRLQPHRCTLLSHALRPASRRRELYQYLYLQTLQDKKGKTVIDKLCLDELVIGREILGKVHSVVSFGAFVDIGAEQNALLHKSQMSNELLEKLSLGEFIECRIRGVSLEKQQVNLTCKEQPSLWNVKSQDSATPLKQLEVGTEVVGKVLRVFPKFAMIDIGATINALLLQSDFTRDRSNDMTEKLRMGDSIQCQIHHIDFKRKRLKVICRENLIKSLSELSRTRLNLNNASSTASGMGDLDGGSGQERQQERTRIEELEVGTEVDGNIVAVWPYGAVVDIGATKDALLHNSGISNDFIEDATALLSVGEPVTCWIKAIDLEKQQIEVTKMVTDVSSPLTPR